MNWRSSASDKSLPRSRKTPFDLGCSRDTSRGCVGRRCTVLSYTFRSHPYQNTVERGWCSKVFFGLRNNDAALREPAIHPEGNAIFGYDGGNHFARNGKVRPRGVFAASDKSLPRSRKTPFDLGCSRDTSRGCVGRRCTVLSYTFRSHPYQNTVERGCCSKVFFGLRNNDAYALASRQYTMRTK